MPECHIDWLKLCFSASEFIRVQKSAFSLLGEGKEDGPRGKFKRSWGFAYGGTPLLWPDGKENGVLDLSGTVCGSLSCENLTEHFGDCRASRLDIAVDYKDDEAALVDLDEVERFGRAGAVAGFASCQTFVSKSGGKTVIFGSMGAGRTHQLVLYDKQAERYDKGAVPGSVGPWIRIEGRFFSTRAEQAWAAIVDGEPMAGLVAGLCQIALPFGVTLARLWKLSRVVLVP